MYVTIDDGVVPLFFYCALYEGVLGQNKIMRSKFGKSQSRKLLLLLFLMSSDDITKWPVSSVKVLQVGLTPES